MSAADANGAGISANTNAGPRVRSETARATRSLTQVTRLSGHDRAEGLRQHFAAFPPAITASAATSCPRR